MPPKKKALKLKGIDGVETSTFSKDQIEQYALMIQDEKNNEKYLRAKFQNEADKIRTFWEISRVDLEKVRAELKNRDRQIEKAEEQNEQELKLYKQKVKHLQFEHQKSLTESKAETLAILKEAESEFAAELRELVRDKAEAEAQTKEISMIVQSQINEFKLQNLEEISKTRNEFEAVAREIEQNYDKKFTALRLELTTKYEAIIADVEKRKNDHVSELTNEHDRNFFEIKNYYNDITLNNLALIGKLKDEMDKQRKKKERMAKQVSDLTVRLKEMEHPLATFRAMIEDYKTQLQNYNKDKVILVNLKTALVNKIKEQEELQWSNDVLQLRYEDLEKESEELHKRFVKAILEVHRKSSIKALLLNKRLTSLNQTAEQKEVIIAELQNAPLMVPIRSNRKFEELLAKKNVIIGDLQYELARVSKAHEDLLDNYEDKLIQYGISKEDLGFIPLMVIPKHNDTGTAQNLSW